MPLFKQSLTEKYTPKTIKLSNLYKLNTQGKKLEGSVFEKTQRAMQASGFKEDEIRKILFKDEPISVKKMQTVAEALNKQRIYGFEKSQNSAIKRYLIKERVKAQTIAGRIRENIIEAGEENLGGYNTTSLNPQSVSPNAPKPGEASIASRYRPDQNKKRTLSPIGGSGKAVSSLSGMDKMTTGQPLSKGIISSKPRF